MKNIAIITARSGSKGLPDKNIKLLCGLPLIAYSIKEAIESKIFSRVMVSTDSEKYADIARKYGAEVPFLRSQEMSGDKAGSWDVVKEVLNNFKSLGEEFDTVCLLQPTSPLRQAVDIVDAYKLFEEKNADNVIGVCESDHSPLWMNTLPKDLSLENFIRKDIQEKNRQQLDTYYRINGAMYITRVSTLMRGDSVYNNSFAFIMPKEKSVDIDSELDFIIAEALMNIRNEKGKGYNDA